MYDIRRTRTNIPVCRRELAVVNVLVVGAGPVGLTLACELARHGVRCRIIDKLSTLAESDPGRQLADLSEWTQQLPQSSAPRLRVVAITQESAADHPNIALYHDRAGAFAKTHGARNTCLLVRPDGHIGWRGTTAHDVGLRTFLVKLFVAAAQATGRP